MTTVAGTASQRLIARIAASANGSARRFVRSAVIWITGYVNVAPKPTTAATTCVATETSYKPEMVREACTAGTSCRRPQGGARRLVERAEGDFGYHSSVPADAGTTLRWMAFVNFLRRLFGLRTAGDWSERRARTDRRSGEDRRRQELSPPDGAERRSGTDRRTGRDRRNP